MRSLLLLVFVMGACAGSASTDSSAKASPPLLRFGCGDSSCDARLSYCEVIKTDVRSLPSTYTCKPLPTACAEHGQQADSDCACFPRGTRCDFCVQLEAEGVRHFQRTCIGGR